MHRPTARRPRRLALAALIALGTACADAAPPEPVVVEVAAQPCDTPNQDRGLGVLIGDGLVATAAHTVEGPRRSVTVDDSPADIVALDERTDLAVLAAEVDGEAAELSMDEPSTADLRTKDGTRPVDVLATGELIVNDATSGLRHHRRVHTFAPAVGSGTSGAPLVDADGAVLGVVVLANRGDGTAYAVTAAEVAELLERMERDPAPLTCPG